MKTHLFQWLVTGFASLAANALGADPRLDSWFTPSSGKYARVYLTDADKNSGNAVATWSRGNLSQSFPAYCGVYEISSSANWVYLRTTGLGSHVMGPWYANAARSQLFMNVPKSSATLFRIPRAPQVTANKTLTGLGAIGLFVDGVVMFDSRDAFSYVNSTGNESNPGDGIWNRDAYINESITFDPALAHQPGNGQYHYHANALALRSLIRDNVLFDPATKTYRENINNPAPAHSPILGWVRDGYPLYGPYGYSIPNNPTSGVRRMVSGFVPRNLNTPEVANRATLPAWAARAQNRSASLTAQQYGPPVSAAHPFGRYLEDNDFLGDLGLASGTNTFDLDEYNGRFCVTPEFPNGTYAYFTAINSSGAPAFPYNIGRQFYGTPNGGTVAGGAYPETVTTNYIGGANSAVRLQPPGFANNGADVTLTWSSVEGGTYVVATTTNFQNWVTNTPFITATGAVARATEPAAGSSHPKRFYKVTRTGTLPPYSN
jgi:hypothetical protein